MRTPEAVHGMLCPVCRTSLSMSDRNGVEIDFCPSCRGVWLDRGELDKIIDRTETSNPSAERLARAGRAGDQGNLTGLASSLLRGENREFDRRFHEDRHYRKKRKSILSDFFD